MSILIIVGFGVVIIALFASKYFAYERDLAEAKTSVDFKTVTGIIKSSIWGERSPAG